MTELLELFEKHHVLYVVVGGYAVNFYGYVRTTQDIDLLVFPSPGNARQVMRALTDFGFGSAGIPESCFAQPGTAVHLGQEPNRVDLLTRLSGVECEDVFADARRVRLGGLEVNMISLDHLIRAKQSSNRVRDRADADELIRTRAKTRSGG